jgi:hypothetical protein
MQNELDAQPGGTSVRILGVNAEGYESGNSTITASRDLPWLQDTFPPGAWSLWGAKKDTVVILDRQNVAVQVFDVAAQPLTVSTNYDQLKSILKALAGE